MSLPAAEFERLVDTGPVARLATIGKDGHTPLFAGAPSLLRLDLESMHSGSHSSC